MYWDKETGRVKFYTNHAGGFLGGISNGDEVRVRLAVKPTPTVDVVQRTIDAEYRRLRILRSGTRHLGATARFSTRPVQRPSGVPAFRSPHRVAG